MTRHQTTSHLIAYLAAFILGGTAITFARAAPAAPEAKLNCTARCAPRAVLAGEAGTCNCAPDDAWLDKMNEKCGPVPYDLKMERDGSFEYFCGRPEKVRALTKHGG